MVHCHKRRPHTIMISYLGLKAGVQVHCPTPICDQTDVSLPDRFLQYQRNLCMCFVLNFFRIRNNMVLHWTSLKCLMLTIDGLYHWWVTVWIMHNMTCSGQKYQAMIHLCFSSAAAFLLSRRLADTQVWDQFSMCGNALKATFDKMQAGTGHGLFIAPHNAVFFSFSPAYNAAPVSRPAVW